MQVPFVSRDGGLGEQRSANTERGNEGRDAAPPDDGGPDVL
jgi:hypothetical protein